MKCLLLLLCLSTLTISVFGLKTSLFNFLFHKAPKPCEKDHKGLAYTEQSCNANSQCHWDKNACSVKSPSVAKKAETKKSFVESESESEGGKCDHKTKEACEQKKCMWSNNACAKATAPVAKVAAKKVETKKAETTKTFVESETDSESETEGSICDRKTEKKLVNDTEEKCKALSPCKWDGKACIADPAKKKADPSTVTQVAARKAPAKSFVETETEGACDKKNGKVFVNNTQKLCEKVAGCKWTNNACASDPAKKTAKPATATTPAKTKTFLESETETESVCDKKDSKNFPIYSTEKKCSVFKVCKWDGNNCVKK